MKKEKVNVTTIPADQQIDLTIGGGFYVRLNKLLIDFGDSKGEQGLIEAIGKINDGESQTDDFAYNFETLIILLRDVEQAFLDAKKATVTEMEFEVKPLTTTDPDQE